MASAAAAILSLIGRYTVYGAVVWGSTTLCIIALARLWPASLRQRFSLLPLGLSSTRRRKRSRNALDTRDIVDWRDWARSLPRSPRTTLLKQIDHAMQQRGLEVCSAGPARSALSLAHLRVAIAHQRRVAAWHPPAQLRAVFGGWIRFCVATMMEGEVDEWRDASGRLLAWTQVVVKGDTLRGMWFYTAETRAMLWFAALRLNVARAITMPGVRWVDAGPSRGEGVAELKTRYGFVEVHEWGAAGLPCTYAGPFVSALTAANVPLWESNDETPKAAAASTAGRTVRGSKDASETKRMGHDAIASAAEQAARTSKVRKAAESKAERAARFAAATEAKAARRARYAAEAAVETQAPACQLDALRHRGVASA